MSMTRRATSHASPSISVHTPPNQIHAIIQYSTDKASSQEIALTAAGESPASHHQKRSSSSAGTTPYSEGLFGRQQAVKRRHLPVHVPAGPLKTRQASPLSTPIAQQGGASTQTFKPVFDALDRFNAAHGKISSSGPGSSEPTQQPLDALDRFNARKGYPVQTPIPHQIAANSSKVSQIVPAQTEPRSRGVLAQPAVPSSAKQQPRQSAGLHANPPLRPQRTMDALDRFNRRKGVKPSSSIPAGQAAEAQIHSRLHAQASEAAQQSLPVSASLHQCKRFQSVGSQHAAEGQDSMAEDSQQSQSTSLASQHVSDLRAVRAACPLTDGFTATHTPDALDRVNSILLARRRSRTDIPAAEPRCASSSPDATVSSALARPASTRLGNQPVGMSIDNVEQSSSVADGAVPSRLYSSIKVHTSLTADKMLSARARVTTQASGSVRNVPLVKKRMRAFDDDDDISAGDILPRKKANMASAVPALHTARTSLAHAQQRGVFMRLAQY